MTAGLHAVLTPGLRRALARSGRLLAGVRRAGHARHDAARESARCCSAVTQDRAFATEVAASRTGAGLDVTAFIVGVHGRGPRPASRGRRGPCVRDGAGPAATRRSRSTSTSRMRRLRRQPTALGYLATTDALPASAPA